MSLRWGHPGKPCTFPPGARLFYTSCHGRMRRPQGRRHGGLGVCFPASCTGISGAAERSAFFLNFLFHSDQLKEIQLRHPPLTNSDLQVRGQGECHPGCCPVAMELLTATGLSRARTLCRARPPACLPDTEGHRGTQSQDSPVVFLMESNPRGLYIFSFNLGHFVSLSENIT